MANSFMAKKYFSWIIHLARPSYILKKYGCRFNTLCSVYIILTLILNQHGEFKIFDVYIHTIMVWI